MWSWRWGGNGTFDFDTSETIPTVLPETLNGQFDFGCLGLRVKDSNVDVVVAGRKQRRSRNRTIEKTVAGKPCGDIRGREQDFGTRNVSEPQGQRELAITGCHAFVVPPRGESERPFRHDPFRIWVRARALVVVLGDRTLFPLKSDQGSTTTQARGQSERPSNGTLPALNFSGRAETLPGYATDLAQKDTLSP